MKEQAAAKANPQAEVARWEAISKHGAWTEMEVIATGEEVESLLRRWPSGIVVYIPKKHQRLRLQVIG